MRQLLARIIQALCCSVLLTLAASPVPTPPSLDSLGAQARERATPAVVRQLTAMAKSPQPQHAALAALALTAIANRNGDAAAASRWANLAITKLPTLTDYAAYEVASAAFAAEDFASAIQWAETMLNQKLPSPLEPQAVALQAQSYLKIKQPQNALALLQRRGAALSTGRRYALLGRAQEALNDFANAARSYQKAYYEDPQSDSATEAAQWLPGLRVRLGDQYPAESLEMILGRASLLARAGQGGKAAVELAAIAPRFSGTDREWIELREAASEYQAGQTVSALRLLQDLTSKQSAVNAERLFYLQGGSRRVKRMADAAAFTDALRAYPNSKWRLEALQSTGNMYLLAGDDASAKRYFAECAAGFPNTETGAACHWKLAWDAFLNRTAAAETLLTEHVHQFPDSDKLPAAVFYLGRLYEARGLKNVAAAHYRLLAANFPNTYYELVARERPGWQREAPAPTPLVKEITALTNGQRRAPIDLKPDANALARVERSRLLQQLGWTEEATNELKFGATYDLKKEYLALELARLNQDLGENGASLRSIKRYVPRYLSLRLEDAPPAFWKLAFPLPYRDSVLRYANENQVDPYLMAGLIRQESEFDPKALSRAKAHGLTQVMPATGRQLARQLGIRGFSNAMLLQPDLNLRLGIRYFRLMTQSLNGMLEATIASYNAGKSRADRWLAERQYASPEEFVESIPFSETRNYVQIVLRNADMYRRIYGPAPAPPKPTAR